MSVSIVVPAYNEEEGLGPTIMHLQASLREAALGHEIIVVDDGSTDRTGDVARGIEGVRVVVNHRNLGYGASLKRGIHAAQHETIVITDADGTYPNERIPDLVAKLGDHVDMVVGWRRGVNAQIPWVRHPAKWVLRKFAEHLVGESIPDLNSGLRVFRRRLALDHERLLPSGFSFTTTITLLVLSGGGEVLYEPIAYHARKGASKFHPIKDVLGMTSLIIRSILLFNPLRVFVPIAVTCFALASLALGISLIWLERILDATIVILLITGLQFLLLGFIADLVNRRSPS